MPEYKKHTKRIATDAAGYLLLVAAIATGWLPGPGGIPLAIAGLGLLSINNAWARRIRDWLLDHGGKIVTYMFPPIAWVRWLYDTLAVLLLGVSLWLGYRHASIWQISAAIGLFCLAIFLALMNRERLDNLKAKTKHKQ